MEEDMLSIVTFVTSQLQITGIEVTCSNLCDSIIEIVS